MSDETEPLADDEISAGPTKAFFVSMITRDIELAPAIVDLVDNSVDGARGLRGEDSYEGLFVELECFEDRFSIRDNCGGIPLDTARKYAFRFGRADGTPGVAHSVGQFGVGMKRALFKLGNFFTVESTAPGSSFLLEVDVPKWAGESKGDWVFPLASYEDDAPVDPVNMGTAIEVTQLHPDVAEDLSSDSFGPELLEDLGRKHRLSIARGLRISVNGADIAASPLSISKSELIKPGVRLIELTRGRPAPVQIKLVAGVGPSEPTEAGWYIYCNDRLVLGPDKSQITGWGSGRGATRIPRWHTQFARFRGFAFFDSDRADQLPLTTTKVGINADSGVWRSSKLQIVEMTRVVITFLNAIDWENPQQIGDGELKQAADAAVPVPVKELLVTTAFQAPSRDDIQPPEQLSSIQYKQPVELIDRAKELLDVTTNSEVGTRTFDYYLDAES